MARIIGITAGLNPTNTPERDEQLAEAKRKKAKLQVAPDARKMKFNQHPVGEIICICCGGQVGFATVRKKLNSTCDHCRRFFGDGMPGSTNMSAEQSLKVISDAREAGWVMLLRRGHWGTKNGDRVEVDAGDIFKVRRAGSLEAQEIEPCSHDKTWGMFTLTVMIGQHELTQFPHEVSAISLSKVLMLQKEKQVEMVYVSKDDDTGHFSPLPALRSQIYERFGTLVGA